MKKFYVNLPSSHESGTFFNKRWANLQRDEPPIVSSYNASGRSVAFGGKGGHSLRDCIGER